jgi:hypothetical protein
MSYYPLISTKPAVHAGSDREEPPPTAFSRLFSATVNVRDQASMTRVFFLALARTSLLVSQL